MTNEKSPMTAEDVAAARRYIRDWTPDHVRDYVEGLEAAHESMRAEAKAGAVDGWKLVPVVPTPQMLRAGEIAMDNDLCSELDVYRAMLEAYEAQRGGKS